MSYGSINMLCFDPSNHMNYTRRRLFFKKVLLALLGKLRKFNTGFLRPKRIDMFIYIDNFNFGEAIVSFL